jgi:hypothetical protein
MASQIPSFSTRAPQVLNSDGSVSFSLPILNTGSAAASNIYITEISLGSATRLDPADLPIFAGTLPIKSTILVNGRFSSAGLTAAQTFRITVQATYELEGLTYGFQVNRFAVIPAAVPPPVSFLNAQINVEEGSGVWSYKILNDEVGDSPNFINAFTLDVVAPVTVTGTPAGWKPNTDGASFVLWYAEDTQPPYPHQIAPGTFLSGFAIQSGKKSSEPTGFAVTAWNHRTNKAGLVKLGAVLSPSRTT